MMRTSLGFLMNIRFLLCLSFLLGLNYSKRNNDIKSNLLDRYQYRYGNPRGVNRALMIKVFKHDEFF